MGRMTHRRKCVGRPTHGSWRDRNTGTPYAVVGRHGVKLCKVEQKWTLNVVMSWSWAGGRRSKAK
jgi:hypothetical protein